jgi:hypothetical protein
VAVRVTLSVVVGARVDAVSEVVVGVKVTAALTVIETALEVLVASLASPP